MPTLLLFGDSVIDNGAYLPPGAPDVAAQVQAALADWTVIAKAVDGDVSTDVVAQADTFAGRADAAFLSVGGNDALGALDLLVDPAPLTFAQVMEIVHPVREDFRSKYRAALGAVLKRTARLLVATIYNPAFEMDEAALQIPAEAALSAYNDVIQQEALARGCGVLELRTLFSEPADYANPIEPSAAGGAKITQRVAAWATAAPAAPAP